MGKERKKGRVKRVRKGKKKIKGGREGGRDRTILKELKMRKEEDGKEKKKEGRRRRDRGKEGYWRTEEKSGRQG